MVKKRKINNPVISMLIFALFTTFSILTIQALLSLLGFDKLTDLGKLFIGLGGGLILAYFSKNFLGIKLGK